MIEYYDLKNLLLMYNFSENDHINDEYRSKISNQKELIFWKFKEIKTPQNEHLILLWYCFMNALLNWYISQIPTDKDNKKKCLVVHFLDYFFKEFILNEPYWI